MEDRDDCSCAQLMELRKEFENGLKYFEDQLHIYRGHSIADDVWAIKISLMIIAITLLVISCVYSQNIRIENRLKR